MQSFVTYHMTFHGPVLGGASFASIVKVRTQNVKLKCRKMESSYL